jgi:hypothetical protein
MDPPTYLPLPINADEGFPQSFRLNFLNNTYQILLYVNVPEPLLAGPDDAFFDLPVPGNAPAAGIPPAPGIFMVMRVAREQAGSAVIIVQSKLVPNLEYQAAELALRFTTMRVAKRNLNGAGSFGSVVSGGIRARWALSSGTK